MLPTRIPDTRSCNKSSIGLLAAHFFQTQAGFDISYPPVFIGYGSFYVDEILAGVERVDDILIPFLQKSAPQFAGAGELIVVGVEGFVKVDEAPDARRFRQVAIDLADRLPNQLVDFGFLR